MIITLLFGSVAHAEYYYWFMDYFNKKVPSPSAGCDLYFSSISKDPGRVFAMEPSKNDPGKTFYCVVTAAATGQTLFSTSVYLKGDRCPEGTDFNKETGECKENKCEILAGSLYEKSHQAPISRFINYLGCEIAVSAIDGCIGPAEGQAGATYCKVIGSFTGNWFTSNGSCAFGCDVGPGDGPPPGGDGGTGGDGGSNPPGGDGGSDGGTKPGGGDNGSSGGGGGGGGGGNNPCQGHVGSDRGTTPGDGSSGGDGDGSGSSGGTGGDGGDGSGGGGLKEPKQGSFDKTIKEYDDAIAKAQKDFQELQGKFESVLASKFDIHLGTGGGSLPCWDFTALGQRYDVCLTQYAQELSVIRYVVLFIAAILAGWIVFYRS
ncbi:hypothetical protein ACT01R_20465 [Pseudomonas aeruginosa]|uniref:hypothetical protein n=1 Tax=Pseudomonas aeruginosa TaxID=287 RepID=UPI003457856B